MKGRDLFKVGTVNELETTDFNLKLYKEGISRICTFPNSAGIDHTLTFTILQNRYITRYIECDFDEEDFDDYDYDYD